MSIPASKTDADRKPAARRGAAVFFRSQSRAQYDRWRAAARQERLSLKDWMIRAADRALAPKLELPSA